MHAINQFLARAATVITAIAAAAPGASAQSRVETFTYQGRLDSSGAPFTGVVNMEFSLWDRPTGGSVIAVQPAAPVEVTGGLFTAELTLPAPTPILPTYLEIEVSGAGGGATVLSPRQQIRPAPLAANATGAEKLDNGDVVFLRSPLRTTASGDSSNTSAFVTTARQTFVSEFTGRPTLGIISRLPLVAGELEISEGTSGQGRVIATGTIAAGTEFATARFDTTEQLIAGNAYTMTVRLPDGADLFYSTVNPYPNGQATFGSGTDLVFSVVVESPDEPVALVDGTGRGRFSRLRVESSSSSDSNVELPTGSINADETREEAGAAAEFGFFGSLPTTLTAVATRSISVPGPGYVLANFAGEFRISHSNGISSSVVYGVSSSSTSISPANNDMQLNIPATAPSGVYEQSGSAVGLFPVTFAGTRTFYVVTDMGNAASISIEDFGFTLLYVPTAYGATD